MCKVKSQGSRTSVYTEAIWIDELGVGTTGLQFSVDDHHTQNHVEWRKATNEIEERWRLSDISDEMSEELSTIRLTWIVYHGDIWCIKMGRDVGWLRNRHTTWAGSRCVLHHRGYPIPISRDPDLKLLNPYLSRSRSQVAWSRSLSIPISSYLIPISIDPDPRSDDLCFSCLHIWCGPQIARGHISGRKDAWHQISKCR